MTPKVSQKMKNMMPKKMGMARYLWVSSRSIFSERCCSWVSPSLMTQSAQSFSM